MNTIAPKLKDIAAVASMALFMWLAMLVGEAFFGQTGF